MNRYSMLPHDGEGRQRTVQGTWAYAQGGQPRIKNQQPTTPSVTDNGAGACVLIEGVRPVGSFAIRSGRQWRVYLFDSEG